jgi:holo-[acyl-carrier protein] synthase
MGFQVGIDLVSRDEVAQALLSHGDRYLERVYTEEERAQSGGRPLALAARFAAKEATLKALRHGDDPVPWRSISVGRDAVGRPTLRLSGAAADIARQARVKRLGLSITYRKRVAAAIVLAELEALNERQVVHRDSPSAP